MAKLQGKKIILGVTGSIAAYKAAFLVRLLVKAGAEVKVLMTEAARDFISPLTLATLSKNEVLTEISSEESWNSHVDLGLWADLMLLAPVTATTLAKLATGMSDNIIVATYLSARCPVFFAPAMDVDMWHHPATRQNVAILQKFGNHLISVAHGELASGLVGEGRMAEPEEILEILEKHFHPEQALAGKTVLITAGPTYEPLDPVRFIGNRSSGKMGIALAEEAANQGARVRLVLGPSRLSINDQPNIDVVRVETALQMQRAAEDYFPEADVAIMAAAVADYRPAAFSEEKIKKKEANLQLDLVKNPDIAEALGKQKKAGQLLVGFALETHDAEENARSKMVRKNFDFIVLNSLADEGAGFNHDTNRISILHQNNKMHKFELKTKTAVAADIIREIVRLLTPAAD